MKADVLSQSNLRISKVSRVFGSFCEILFIVSPLDCLYWAKSRNLKSILDQRIVANMFYAPKSKQVVKLFTSPALCLCSNLSKFTASIPVGLNQQPLRQSRAAHPPRPTSQHLSQMSWSTLIINYLTCKKFTLQLELGSVTGGVFTSWCNTLFYQTTTPSYNHYAFD